MLTTMKLQDKKEIARELGLEVSNSRFTGNTTAKLSGYDEIFMHWEDEEELFTWAYNVSGEEKFLELID